MDFQQTHLCRICITTHTSDIQMLSIFGEDSLWKKIIMLANVQIEPGDTLPQLVCITCAEDIISAYRFKQKCEEADNFFRQQLLLQNIVHTSESDRLPAVGQFQEELAENSFNATTGKCDSPYPYADSNADAANCHLETVCNSPQEASDFSNDVDLGEKNLASDDVDRMDVKHHPAVTQKPPFDFHSIRLMHEYMLQQQLSKLGKLKDARALDISCSNAIANGTAASDDNCNAGEDEVSNSLNNDDPIDDGRANANVLHNGHNVAVGNESGRDEDEETSLPLIPEIELITQSEETNSTNPTHNNPTFALMEHNEMRATCRGFQCPQCYQFFNVKQLLRIHMQRIHGAAGPIYECNNCKKTYYYKRFLEKHIRRGRCVKKRRNQTRPMQCSDCHVLFPTGHHLGWHKRTGCPSKAAKMPLQQLLKQNIVQYNNFPKRIGIRKPENAIYLHNRRLIISNNKRKGRTRIKLDAKKIALAKQLILREATTTVIANELNISRTFAWRLRKNLVNGISLHERVIDPLEEDVVTEAAEEPTAASNAHKIERIESDAITKGQTNEENSIISKTSQQQILIKEEHQHVVNSALSQGTDQVVQMHQLIHSSSKAIEQMQKLQKQQQQQQQQREQQREQYHLIGSHTQQQEPDQHPSQHEQSDEFDSDDENQNHQHHQDNSIVGDNNLNHLKPQFNKLPERQQFYLPAIGKPTSATHTIEHNALLNGGQLPILTQFASVTTNNTANQLPVNLSIRPIESMQNNELVSRRSANTTTSASSVVAKKKPRKPNVFIDDEKYDIAKLLVNQNSSTMEIAKALNVSQMTAWKLRDAIIKGIPLSYRNKREMRQHQRTDESNSISRSANGSSNGTAANVHVKVSECRREANDAKQESKQKQADKLLIQQRLEATPQLPLLRQHPPQHPQQQLQQLLNRKQQGSELKEQQKHHQQQQQQKQHHQQHKQQQQQQQLLEESLHKSSSLHPRRRLKAVERELRDREVTREILELIKEDNNIQYWKVSARLAEKGYAISPSSVCQKLKSLGIHRRWKQGDKALLLDMEQLKTTNAAMLSITPTLSAITHQAANAMAINDNYERHQFGIDGGHFLSALTR